ncbi:MAG: hypothetical protein ILO10_02950 [Kiritimatiellae bacterium]|nr:hypothetical protein [Kiritimatiellia bacterium]
MPQSYFPGEPPTPPFNHAARRKTRRIVLIERKTRRYLVRKLPVLSQDAVLRLLRRLCASGTMGRVLSVTTALQCFLQESA